MHSIQVPYEYHETVDKNDLIEYIKYCIIPKFRRTYEQMFYDMILVNGYPAIDGRKAEYIMDLDQNVMLETCRDLLDTLIDAVCPKYARTISFKMCVVYTGPKNVAPTAPHLPELRIRLSWFHPLIIIDDLETHSHEVLEELDKKLSNYYNLPTA